jgi:hypothetical protein
MFPSKNIMVDNLDYGLNKYTKKEWFNVLSPFLWIVIFIIIVTFIPNLRKNLEMNSFDIGILILIAVVWGQVIKVYYIIKHMMQDKKRSI